jgi:hypothetical protein
MAVTAPRETWTDPRIDDLSETVDAGFSRVDADIRELRGEMKSGFDRFDKKFDRLTFTLLAAAAGAILTHLL